MNETPHGLIDERLAQVEARLGTLEDMVSICNLMALYGPAVDSDSRAVAAAIWTEDGEYNVNPSSSWLQDGDPGGSAQEGGNDPRFARWTGREEIQGMIASHAHQSRIAAGCAHQVSAPHVRITGDTAVATCYQTLILRRDGAFQIDRLTANRWEFVRTSDGWRVTKRTNRLLDGDEEARALLARGAAERDGAAVTMFAD